MPGGVLQFIPFYHPMHDIGGVHSENCVIILALTFFLIAWSADRQPIVGSRRPPGLSITILFRLSREKHTCVNGVEMKFAGVYKGFNECVLGLLLHYSCYMVCLLNFKPEDEVSIGVHEKLGPCDEFSPVVTAFGMVSPPDTTLPPSRLSSLVFHPQSPHNRRSRNGSICVRLTTTRDTLTSTVFPAVKLRCKELSGTQLVERLSPIASSTLWWLAASVGSLSWYSLTCTSVRVSKLSTRMEVLRKPPRRLN